MKTTVRDLLNDLSKYELDAEVLVRRWSTNDRRNDILRLLEYEFVGTATRVQDGPALPVHIELLVQRPKRRQRKG